jgi:hypothetical protein
VRLVRVLEREQLAAGELQQISPLELLGRVEAGKAARLAVDRAARNRSRD